MAARSRRFEVWVSIGRLDTLRRLGRASTSRILTRAHQQAGGVGARSPAALLRHGGQEAESVKSFLIAAGHDTRGAGWEDTNLESYWKMHVKPYVLGMPPTDRKVTVANFNLGWRG